SSSIAEVTTRRIIGAAMRFITSAPACHAGDHMIGSRPKRIAQTVMIFGRIRWTAPSLPARERAFLCHAACGTVFLPSVVEVKEHDHPGLGIESGERDQSHP